MTDAALGTTCCIAGGGPAGVMLGYLLARRGVRVTVLEKHKDFFRDFRGDTVHPSTLQVLYELGLLERFLQLPHQRVESVGAVVGGYAFPVADFRHLPAHCKFVVLMPQWDFLDFLSAEAKKFAGFDLRTEHEALDLLHAGKRIIGVRARTPLGTIEIGADLVVGCDGRHSVVRQAADLELREFGVPIDVLWFRISRKPGDPHQVLGNVNYGKALILIDRADYFQAGLIIPKGSFEEIREHGLDEFREAIARIVPFLKDRVGEVSDWEQVKILTVQINRLRRWYREGLLCIGDAAHAMSPAGGVGINLAIQDAVAAANLLAEPLLQRKITTPDLARVQDRRALPTLITQAVQVQIHKGFAQVFKSSGPVKAPWQLKLAVRIPGIHRALGYAVGMGVRPEHVADGAREQRRCVPVLREAAGLIVGIAVAVHTFRKLRARAAGNARA